MLRKQINTITIKPVVHLALKEEEILGYDYFPTLYSNIYIYVVKENQAKQHSYITSLNTAHLKELMLFFLLYYTSR